MIGNLWDMAKFLLCVLIGLVVLAHTSFQVRRAQARERRQAQRQQQQEQPQAAVAVAVAVTGDDDDAGGVPESWKPPADERVALAAAGIRSPEALMLLQAMRAATRGARERGHVAGCRCHWCAEMSYGGPIDQAQEGSAA